MIVSGFEGVVMLADDSMHRASAQCTGEKQKWQSWKAHEHVLERTALVVGGWVAVLHFWGRGLGSIAIAAV